jgi:hypothetical protein
MYLSFYLEFLFLLSVIFTAASSSVSQGPYLSSPRRCLSEGWPYLRRQHITSMNTKFVKIRSSNLKNQILQFFKNFKLSSSTNRTNDPKTSPPLVQGRGPTLSVFCILFRDHIVRPVRWTSAILQYECDADCDLAHSARENHVNILLRISCAVP